MRIFTHFAFLLGMILHTEVKACEDPLLMERSGLRQRQKISALPKISEEDESSQSDLGPSSSLCDELYKEAVRLVKVECNYAAGRKRLKEILKENPSYFKAHYSLGVLYEHGVGVKKSLQKAAEHYTKAYDKSPKAQKALKRVITAASSQ